ncbi:MAG: MoaD/ThiS family protein [Rhodobacteraceae bacterium]|nr:MoaD/ThiS family protein [Paracoccaceae bacterium]
MGKVKVNLWSGLRAHTDGLDVVEVEAGNIGEMLSALAAMYPGLGPVIEAGVSVSVDGRIIASSLDEPVRAKNDIYLMQRLKGG